MKKIITIILMTTILATTGVAYAAGANQTTLQEKRENLKAKAGSWNVDKTQLKERAALIKEKHAKVKALRTDAHQKIQAIKNQIKTLKKNPDSLTEEKITEISEKLSLIRSDKTDMAGTWGKVAEETLKLKLSKKNKDYDAAVANLNNIISVLDSRITVLEKTNADLDALLALF